MTRDSAQQLPGVSVTASRGLTSILTTPLAVTKIGTAELRGLSGYGLDGALGKVPGVLAQSRFGTSDVRIVIRGFGARGAGDRSNAGTSRGIRVLVDGIPETEPDGRTAFDQVDLATASSVEVVRSNASSLWGNAAGGVINILTPTWSDHAVAEFQPLSGSFGMRRYAVRTSMPLRDGTAYVNFTNTDFDGWRDHSDARRALVNAGFVAQTGDDTRVALYASGANHLYRIPGPLTLAQFEADPRQANATYKSRDERRYNRIARIAATIEHSVNRRVSFSSMLFASPKYLQRSERNTFRDFTRYHVGGNVAGNLTFDVGATTKSRLTFGVDEAYQDGAILFYSLVNGQRGPTLADNKAEGANSFGAFVHDELQIGDRLQVNVGARLDRISYYNKNFINPGINADKAFEQVTPKVGASWKLGPTRSVYANLGGGIEVPAGNELDPYASQGTTSINPLLDPIRSTTVELGYKAIGAMLGSITMSGDLAVYSTSVKNDLLPYNSGRFYMSAGRTRRSGVELGVSGEARNGVFGNLALTVSRNRYLDYTVDSSLFITNRAAGTGVFDDNKVIGVPDVMGAFELGATVPGASWLRAKAGVEHVGKYFADDANLVQIPAYTVLNATLQLTRPIFATRGVGLTGFVTVHNVTDKTHVGSAFLNPDYVSGAAVAYEPGMPRSVTVSFSLGRLH